MGTNQGEFMGPTHILIVEDEADQRLFLHEALTHAGFGPLYEAASGSDALKLLSQLAEQQQPLDLILMDIMLPDMDGVEACRRIKQDRRFSDIPVVFVTAQRELSWLNSALDAGGIEYLKKPINPLELAPRINAFLRLKRETDYHRQEEARMAARIAELAELNRELETLSYQDGLTAIPNRRSFDDLLERFCRYAVRDRLPLSLLMIDIDHFKLYNDTYGHLQGDQCLKQVAGILREMARRPGDICARFGGEEFVMALLNTDQMGASQVAELLRQRIESLHLPHAASPVSAWVTVSVGTTTCEYPLSGECLPAELLAAADRALYQAKKHRNKIACVNLQTSVEEGIL
jgi:diguanylate cyclase (GGDEF)-like protein